MASLALRSVPEIEIVSNAEIMGGWPCVEGTRVPAETVYACIRAGYDRRELYRAYPYLPLGSFEAVLKWATGQDRSCSAS